MQAEGIQWIPVLESGIFKTKDLNSAYGRGHAKDLFLKSPINTKKEYLG